MRDLERSEADDEEFLVEQEKFISEQSRYQTPEHFYIDKSRTSTTLYITRAAHSSTAQFRPSCNCH